MEEGVDAWGGTRSSNPVIRVLLCPGGSTKEDPAQAQHLRGQSPAPRPAGTGARPTRRPEPGGRPGGRPGKQEEKKRARGRAAAAGIGLQMNEPAASLGRPAGQGSAAFGLGRRRAPPCLHPRAPNGCERGNPQPPAPAY